MKILWLLRRTLYAHFNGELERAVEELVGKDNITFYGNHKLPIRDKYYNPYYPPTYKCIEDYPLKDIIDEENPDIIVVDKPCKGGASWKTADETSPQAEIEIQLKKLDIPRVTFMNDAHAEWKNRKLRAKNKEVDIIFVRSYGGGIGYRVKNELCSVGYCPSFVSPSYFKPSEEKRINDVFLAGVRPIIYPYRFFIYHKIVTRRFPRTPPSKRPSHFILDGIKYVCASEKYHVNYNSTINNSKMFVFDGGLFRYPVLKIFEGMMSNVLTMFDLPFDYKALRFEPNKNMVELDFFNFEEQFKYYLENESERKKIIQEASRFVLNYHTAKIRAKQLLEQFNEVINAHNEKRLFDSGNVRGEAGRMLHILEENEENFNRNSLLHQTIDRGYPYLQEWYKEAGKKWDKHFSTVTGGFVRPNSEIKWKEYIDSLI